MTDRKLLELAAKAAGIEILDWYGQRYSCLDLATNRQIGWNPLTDDGDALRLAVKLKIEVYQSGNASGVLIGQVEKIELHERNVNPYAATRRAIVRAAAEIGKGMK
jgi:hypothetical protein